MQIVGIDETSLKRGQHYVTVVHDLDAKRLLFPSEGRDHKTVLDFAAELEAHGRDPAEVRHVCMDMSAACVKGAALALPQADISYDRFHVIAMASGPWTTCDARSCVPRARRGRHSAVGRRPGNAAQPAVEHAQEPQRLERRADHRDALAAALCAQGRASLAAVHPIRAGQSGARQTRTTG